MTDLTTILDDLKKIDYLYDVSAFYGGWGKEVIGYNASASSLLRKRFTLVRIKELIDKNQWPLDVDDCWGEGYVAFRLMIKN